ncbi:hypothetical protein OIU79_001620 [Salix purpurea]|uniref:Uncharacterized protein n=1 Tax=Salix purpurea TaxID=77065 RepID=A0A9Q0ZH91_SALPP|nr:hypothetical protein OIU79_001620 [Salix purpurea]
MEHSEETQGLVVAGGGERNGMEGSVAGIGIVGIEGIRVGMLGSGGKVSFGTAGIAGIVGRLGSGGKVGLGSEGSGQKANLAIAEDYELLGHQKRQSNEESQEKYT